MIILGLDIATTCGWALLDTKAERSSTLTGAFYASGDEVGEKYGEFGAFLIPLLRRHSPDFVSIERPLPIVVGQSNQDGEATMNPASAQQMSGLFGAAVGIIWGGYKIPYGTIAPQTWHSKYFEKGFKPPNRMRKVRATGQIVDTGKKDWKRAAIEQALRDKVKLPETKVDGREDAAEAVAVAACWAFCAIPPHSDRLNERKFLALRTGQPSLAA